MFSLSPFFLLFFFAKISHIYELEKLISFKVSTLTKAAYRFNAITVKDLVTLFTEIEKKS